MLLSASSVGPQVKAASPATATTWLSCAGEVAGGGHAERGGERGAGVARAVGIVLGFGAQQEAVEALEGADGVDLVGTAGEHLVDVSLMGDVEDELVLRGGEDAVQGDGQFDDAEIGAEVAAGLGKRGDERMADFRGELRQLLVGEFFDIAWGLDGLEQRTECGRLRRGGCHRRRRRRPAGRTGGRDQGFRRFRLRIQGRSRFGCGG